jgi:hypothetical protein
LIGELAPGDAHATPRSPAHGPLCWSDSPPHAAINAHTSALAAPTRLLRR